MNANKNNEFTVKKNYIKDLEEEEREREESTQVIRSFKS